MLENGVGVERGWVGWNGRTDDTTLSPVKTDDAVTDSRFVPQVFLIDATPNLREQLWYIQHPERKGVTVVDSSTCAFKPSICGVSLFLTLAALVGNDTRPWYRSLGRVRAVLDLLSNMSCASGGGVPTVTGTYMGFWVNRAGQRS